MFLPMQLIYGGKTLKSLPNFEFPDSFSLSANPKHFSNTQESIKVVTEIIVPYVENQRKELQKQDQAALLILDVFRGQITEDVTSLLQKHNILLRNGIQVKSKMSCPLEKRSRTLTFNFV